MGWRGRPSESGRAGKTPQAFSATRSLTGLWTGAKTGLPSFSFLAMAPMQQSAAIATTAAAMRPPTSLVPCEARRRVASVRKGLITRALINGVASALVGVPKTTVTKRGARAYATFTAKFHCSKTRIR